MHHATRGFVIFPVLSASTTTYSSIPPTFYKYINYINNKKGKEREKGKRKDLAEHDEELAVGVLLEAEEVVDEGRPRVAIASDGNSYEKI
jgi:hypothetical protein